MGFDHSHYVPILKGKQGELNALLNTDSVILAQFTPLIEVPRISLEYPEGNGAPYPEKTIDEHVVAIGKSFAKALKGLPSFFLDGYYIELEDELADGSSPIDTLFGAMRQSKLPFIPVIGLDRVEDYTDSVRAAMQIDKRGCCLRLWEPDLEGFAELASQIDKLLGSLGTEPKDVDLLIDFGPKVPAKSALPFIIDSLPSVDAWRTLTVASSSFPSTLMALKQNRIEELEREEWLTWLSIRSRSKTVKRVPTYGDYGINHPIVGEIDPKIMNMSPNIRYTDSVNYVVAKGQAQPRKKKAVTLEQKAAREKLAHKHQYPKLAAMIIEHSAWKGTAFSWGDGFIDRCSHRDCVGSSTDWRAVGMCHHIASVVLQLASLP